MQTKFCMISYYSKEKRMEMARDSEWSLEVPAEEL